MDNPAVLLVDDEEQLRAFAETILSSHGCRVLAAHDGNHALKLAREHEVHLLLTDVEMPGMTGPQLAEQLKSTHPGIRVLFMTGGDCQQFHEDEVILKPFSPAGLVEKVRARMFVG